MATETKSTEAPTKTGTTGPTTTNAETGDVDAKVQSEYLKHEGDEPKTYQTSFTYPTHTDPARQLVRTSLYLDDVQREQAEVARAKVEGREPDLENPGSTQGTPLVPTHVVQAGLTGDAAALITVDVTLPVVAGTYEQESDKRKVEAVPFYEVSKKDLDESGKVSV